MKPPSQKCDKCDKPATVHLTEIIKGKSIEKHLCQDCAAAEGVTHQCNVPISKLLEEFILQSDSGPAADDPACDVCGLTFSEFRKTHLLGCPNDYDAFAPALDDLLRRVQEGVDHHVGKIPARAEDIARKSNAIIRLRAELHNAVASEDYEHAAALRDRIRELDES